MSVDPKGTSPGLAPVSAAPQTVSIKCKKCPSMTAAIIAIGSEDGPMNHQRLYRCVSCNATWGINVGGFVNL
jgi:hypothetical protein